MVSLTRLLWYCVRSVPGSSGCVWSDRSCVHDVALEVVTELWVERAVRPFPLVPRRATDLGPVSASGRPTRTSPDKLGTPHSSWPSNIENQALAAPWRRIHRSTHRLMQSNCCDGENVEELDALNILCGHKQTFFDTQCQKALQNGWKLFSSTSGLIKAKVLQ